ncbi:solute carrier family 49 member 4 isoform X3 [Acanthochromis polyacanthus]|uniref:solute carrier family 49 member 4 isoform X3 n=1 Tax=Acanthochromis polyacanthus TaxID=80966 RepID=UPI002234797F|nr:solute carrier family 49 member 4 isoform X3 [Acanthochromis polyacanthus]
MGAGSSTEAEREPLLAPSYVEPNSPPVNSRVYGRRWLVLTLFSLLGLMQGMVWNFWGPIQNSAAHAYGFTKSDIAVLVLWGPVGYFPWLLFMWLMDKKGLRASLLLSAFFMLLGSALRSIPLTDQPLRRWLIHGGQFLNGLAGPTIMSAGPFLSTTWFAPDQRATATAVASLFSYLGGAASFVVGPLVVPPPNDTQAGTTMTAAILDNSIRDRIQLVLYTELAAIVVLFAAVLLYFPSRPPMPPSVAAASQRLSYRNSICRLLSNLRFLMIAVAYAVPTGVMAGWSGVLDMVLTPAKVSQVAGVVPGCLRLVRGGGAGGWSNQDGRRAGKTRRKCRSSSAVCHQLKRPAAGVPKTLTKSQLNPHTTFLPHEGPNKTPPHNERHTNTGGRNRGQCSAVHISLNNVSRGLPCTYKL